VISAAAAVDLAAAAAADLADSEVEVLVAAEQAAAGS
jgi:hypothetical protein